MSFWEARFLWQEPMLAAAIGAALLGYLGFFVVLRRIAFMSAALSQVSGLGVAVAFWVGSFAGVSPHEATPLWLSPGLYAFLFAAAGAGVMSLPSRSRRVTPESAVALAYLASSALVMVVLSSPRIAQEAHEVGDLLFGNAVTVSRDDLYELAVAAVVTLIAHGLFFKELLFSSFDADTARVSGVPVRRMGLLLHLTLALGVAVATRALGALPVFAFLVLPAGAALLFSERLKVVLVLSVVISVLCGTLGYYLSWTLSLPTGSLMVSLAALVWTAAGLKRLVDKLRRAA
ncbi:MAG: metal ABC transporter permease [Archangiaceae bacterium]|nr:metal ABC transporter permease [Archangiaceae bacterium]